MGLMLRRNGSAFLLQFLVGTHLRVRPEFGNKKFLPVELILDCRQFFFCYCQFKHSFVINKYIILGSRDNIRLSI